MRSVPDADVVVDALGGLADRQALEKAAAEKGVPVVSAGIAGLTGWCKAIFPGETGPASLLAGEGDRPTPDEILGNLAPTVFLAASLQAALVLQILTGKPVRREALFFDLEDGTFTQVVLVGGHDETHRQMFCHAYASDPPDGSLEFHGTDVCDLLRQLSIPSRSQDHFCEQHQERMPCS